MTSKDIYGEACAYLEPEGGGHATVVLIRNGGQISYQETSSEPMSPREHAHAVLRSRPVAFAKQAWELDTPLEGVCRLPIKFC